MASAIARRGMYKQRRLFGCSLLQLGNPTVRAGGPSWYLEGVEKESPNVPVSRETALLQACDCSPSIGGLTPITSWLQIRQCSHFASLFHVVLTNNLNLLTFLN